MDDLIDLSQMILEINGSLGRKGVFQPGSSAVELFPGVGMKVFIMDTQAFGLRQQRVSVNVTSLRIKYCMGRRIRVVVLHGLIPVGSEVLGNTSNEDKKGFEFFANIRNLPPSEEIGLQFEAVEKS